jgi:membrane protein
MNRAYNAPESRTFIKRYVISLGLTILAGLFIISAFIVFVTGQVLGERVAELLGVEGVFATLTNLARWVFPLILVLIATAFIYWAAPNMELKFKWVTPGSILFTLGWAITSSVFAFYISNFTDYTATYGALGGVAVLLLWFYLTSFILLLGAEVNAVIDEQIEPEEMRKQRSEKQSEAAQQESDERREDSRGGSREMRVIRARDEGEPVRGQRQDRAA